MTPAEQHSDQRSGAGSPPAGRRRLTEQGRERKQQIIDAALALFADHGYGATRIADICERAGVAKGLFYWYFPTKLDLFTELVRSMRRRLRRTQAEAMAAADDPLTRLRLGTVASVLFMAEHATFFDLVDVERTDGAIADVLRSGSRVYLADVTTVIRDAQVAGEAVDADPRFVAVGVLGAVSSFSNSWRSGHIDATATELAEQVGDWVVRAVRSPGAAAGTAR